MTLRNAFVNALRRREKGPLFIDFDTLVSHPVYDDPALGERWAELRDLRRVVTGALEVERAQKRIGSSLQATVEIYVPERLLPLLRDIDLAELCITSEGTVRAEAPPADAFTLPDVAEIGVLVKPAAGTR